MELAQDIRLPQQDWDAFRNGYSPFSFAEVVDRAQLGFPAWFMPNARGAVVPSAQVLKPNSKRRARPPGWHEIMPGIFREGRGQFGYITIRFGGLWSIIAWDQRPSAVAFHCGATPVMFHSDLEAKWVCRRLREFQVDGRHRPRRSGYRWTPILPSSPDPAAVDALAVFRGSLEAADLAYWIKYDKLDRRPLRKVKR